MADPPPPPPRRISDKVHVINITGYVFPCRDGQPVWFDMPGTPDVFLAVFSTANKLRDAMADVDYDGIKQIDDAAEFLSSLPQRFAGRRLRLMVDPYATLEGRTRFTEIQRYDS